MLNPFFTANFVMCDSAASSEDQFIHLDTGKIFQDYARNLAREGKFKEALSVYSASTKQSGPNQDIVSDVGQLLIQEYCNRHAGSRRAGPATDPWSCSCCAGVLMEPVTMSCGHSACKKCLLKDICERCRKCGNKYKGADDDPVNDSEHIKVSILVSELVSKYWSKELKAIELRNEGNKLFTRGEVENSIQRYSEAFALAPNDHLLTSNRSHAYYKLADYESALEDAERAITCRPDWGKGYFRKGMALHALGRLEEALKALFECLALEGNSSKPLKVEIICVLGQLLLAGAAVQSAEDGAKEKEEAATVPASKDEQEQQESTPGNEGSDEGKENARKGDDRGKLLVPRNHLISRTLEEVESRFGELCNLNYKPDNRHIDPAAVNKEDFDCSLCFRLLWQPVTTNCGHTYCKSCLDRSLDHRRECPLCKTDLEVLNGKLGVNEFVEQTIQRMLPAEFLERQRVFEEEMTELAGNRKDGRVEIPVFVCTMSFPSIPCPLHVFEPRYRLMIRRAMENGTREFGMCINDPVKGFSDYGTMLEIRDIQYFADGRSVVDTMGSRRFRVIERGTKDGYHTAVVEFMKDTIVEGQELEDLKGLHERTRSLAVGWFDNMDQDVKVNVTSHYGSMPRVETEFWNTWSGPAWAWWVLAILPLDTMAQQHILSQTSLKKRLEAIGRILGFMKRRGGVPS